MRTRDNKLIKFILEISQILLVFLGVFSAIMCTATSLELTFSRGICALVLLLAAFLFYGLFTVLETFRKGKAYGILGITLFFALIIFYFREPARKGFVTIVNGFLKEFMNYSGSRLTLLSYNSDYESVSVRFCTTFVLILLGVYLTVIVSAFFYRRRRARIFVVLTAPFVAAPLVVGRMGYFSNVFTYLIVMASVIGTRHLKTDATDRRMRQKLSILLMLVGLAVGGISYLYMPPSRYEGSKGKITEVKNTVVALGSWSNDDIFAWVKAYFNDDAFDYGSIGGKREVTYTGETMLKISGTVNHLHGMYLKGFVGDCYEENQWTSLANDEGYQSELANYEKRGISPNNWHIQMRNELGESEVSGADDLWKTGMLRIRNLAFGYGNYVVPYLPVSSFKSEENGRTTIDTLGIDYTVEYYLVYPYIMRRDLMNQNYSVARMQFWDGNQAERQQMTDFARKYYLQVPDSLTAVVEDFRKYLNDNGGLYDKSRNGTADMGDILREVKNYITEDTEYSLAPGKTPSGKDTVEYFLMEGKKGYCTYYASAAAILLRSVGVPTRYVEGMYISQEELVAATETQEEILVPDSDAHAWVEVYDEKYGFVPMEVTPGVGEDEVETPDDQTGNTSDRHDPEPPENEDGSGDTPEQATPTPAVTQVPEEDMVFDDIDGNEEPDEEAGTDGASSVSGQRKVVLIVLEIVAALVVFALVMEVTRRVRRYLFLRSLKSLRIKRRIRIVHHHLMPLFGKRGAGYSGQPVAEYAALIANAMDMPLGQIMGYVEMVFHARFGPDDITEAQMAEFRTCYEAIRSKAYGDAKIMKKLYYMYIMIL